LFRMRSGRRGVNLAWTTSVPGLAFPFAPLTLVFGPVVAYNVAAVLMPALDAWTAFLLCRYLTRSWWPSLLGGYVFGFSGYLVAQEETNLHLTAVFLLPVAALLVVRFLDGDLGATAFALSSSAGCWRSRATSRPGSCSRSPSRCFPRSRLPTCSSRRLVRVCGLFRCR
jgi:hypothetical protein